MLIDIEQLHASIGSFSQKFLAVYQKIQMFGIFKLKDNFSVVPLNLQID